jgi:hypothetical protein
MECKSNALKVIGVVHAEVRAFWKVGVGTHWCSRCYRAATGYEGRRSRPARRRRSSDVRAEPAQLLDPKSAIDAAALAR